MAPRQVRGGVWWWVLAGLAACRGPDSVPDASTCLALWLDGIPQAPAAEAVPPGEEAPAAAPLAALPREEVLMERRRLQALLQENVPVDRWPEGLRSWGRARERLARGELDEAAVELKDRLEAVPGDFAARTLLGDVRTRQRRFGEAVSLLEGARRRAPDDPVARLALAQALAARREPGDLARAETELRALAGEPLLDPIQVARSLVAVLDWAGRPGEAARVAEEALLGAPDHPALLLDLATCLLHDGRPEEALAPAARVAAPPLGPQPEALWLEGRVLRRLGRAGEAARCLEALLAGSGPAFDRFFLQTLSRGGLEQHLQVVRLEAARGRRLDYFSGEVAEILGSDRSAARRLAAVQSWAADPRLPDEALPVLERALADEDPQVQAAALSVIGQRFLDRDRGWALILAALGGSAARLRVEAASRLEGPLVDPDPRVRRLAETVFTPERRERALSALLSALERENDGAAFAAGHAALKALSGRRVLLMRGEEDEPGARARIVKEWKEKLAR